MSPVMRLFGCNVYLELKSTYQCNRINEAHDENDVDHNDDRLEVWIFYPVSNLHFDDVRLNLMNFDG